MKERRTKVCPKCGQRRKVEYFFTCRLSPSGEPVRHTFCKLCERKRQRELYHSKRAGTWIPRGPGQPRKVKWSGQVEGVHPELMEVPELIELSKSLLGMSEPLVRVVTDVPEEA